MQRKVAIVTGASRGIGKAIACTLAVRGYAVCINYNNHGSEAEELASRLNSEGFDAIALRADVSERNAVFDMIAQVKNRFGKIDLLVNNAGISEQSLFQDVTEEAWHRYFSVNVDGAFHAIQAVLPDMIHEKTGNIVNISSIWGLRGASCEVAYSCTKAAIIGLTRSLAAELAPSGIRVNAVAPGVIKTDMMSAYSDETLAQLASETPIGRLGTPEDIAAAVAFLASDEAGFITGQVLTADGGFIL